MIGMASSGQQIQEAVSLLESFGVKNLENLCSFDASVSEVIPFCDEDDSIQVRRILVPQNFQTVAEEEAFYTTNIVGAILCVCAVAIIAGLFLGYLTLDVMDLQVKSVLKLVITSYSTLIEPCISHTNTLSFRLFNDHQ
jgi:hypothetical protein